MKNKIINIKKDRKKIISEVNERIKRHDLIERICRKICENQGINPERLVCKMMPELFNYPFIAGYYLPNPQFTMPAWMLYRELVETTLEISKSI